MSSKILAGRYELLEKIGDGGMAVVYKAKCRLLNRYVAIKILKPEFIKDAKFIESFRRESQAAASLSHPNIVNVFDVGKEGNIYYIVMELIEGEVLSDLIKRTGAMEPKVAVSVAKQIASALSVAHKNHIVHRDVKPHNVLVTMEGVAKITDFGIAKAVNNETIVNNTGTIMGSVHYFSPEQARGGYVDEKSDIYSLGIVLYELLTGKVPFDGDNPVTVALMHINDEITPPSRYNPRVSPELDAVVMKATNKYQVSRYRTADEMYEALDRVNRGIAQGGRDPGGGLDLDATRVMAAVNGGAGQDLGMDLQGIGLGAAGGYAAGTGASNAYAGTEDREGYEAPRGRQGYETPSGSSRNSGNDEEEDEEQGKMRKNKKDKNGSKGKKKLKVNKIKIAAIILALVCAIPASHLVLSAFDNFSGKADIKVPELAGKTVDEATTELKDLGLKIEVGEEVSSSEYEEGEIVSQDPLADSPVKKGAIVTVNVCNEKTEDSVPNLLGKDESGARKALESRGFELGLVSKEKSSQPEGTVIDQDPSSGDKVEKGSTVNITLSAGNKKDKVSMIDVKGLSLDSATKAIQGLNLVVGNTTEEASSAYSKGQVIWQSLTKGEEVEEGTTVDLKVSKGPAESEPQSVAIEMDYSAAQNDVFTMTVVVSDKSGVNRPLNQVQRSKYTDTGAVGGETLSVSGTGKGTVTIIFDGTEVKTYNVNFDTREVS